MKTLLLCTLVFVCLPAWADDASTTNAAPAPAPADERTTAIQIDHALMDMAHGGDSSQANWDAIGAQLDNYQKQFGVSTQTTHNLVLLRTLQIAVAKRLGDQRFNDLLTKLASDPQPEVQALAAKVVALKTKPVDLKYTAIDGTEVDLSKMRGKVVLIDFWATWCAPCVGEVPNVVAAYKKYHDQGFEIAGVSLDQDKDAMLAFTKQHGMVWPQYFDGKGWNNEVSKGYGIDSIPAMWLIDKKGMLVTTDGREDLAGHVGKLLAAP